ncbi:hypothetical protein L3H50_08570 [Corynebacterium sp. MC-04]|uniref:Secreted protein n=1 Tax=Corynebacterium parakroppenstedtii TaxID=2828363 RepID=A0ABS9HP32_9CORY|nr:MULTISPECIES: hypothetical protein [Corynebacterium]KXB50091.1 hypothetical protein HMPREF1861_01563 [Corynebacterium kroppenstedtii]MBY0789330.1 hypothetical protein [Corynebacterium parakroppenstedtii]MBY0793495.1 hypothetical protein [Corynebacterium parakroppenstedtii]MBY0797255.1 hypothetical protein [Corynebacterium parakroppenstedtii]MCF6770339.1 hypothetical protein [Corynebacterium parakroppenstedtii]
MSAQGNYNGLPHPPEIYRRRRIAAVVIVVVVIALLWWIISALSGGGDSSSTATESSVTTTTTKSTKPTSSSRSSESTRPSSESEDPDESESEEPDASEEPSVAPDAKETCDVNDLQVEARTDADSYEPGQMPRFYLIAHNPTKGSCHVDLAKTPMKFEVYNLETNERVWSDVDCNNPAATGALDIGAGQTKNYMLSWSRTTSAPGECSDRVAVPSGSYYLHTLIGNQHSEPTTFNLT